MMKWIGVVFGGIIFLAAIGSVVPNSGGGALRLCELY